MNADTILRYLRKPDKYFRVTKIKRRESDKLKRRFTKLQTKLMNGTGSYLTLQLNIIKINKERKLIPFFSRSDRFRIVIPLYTSDFMAFQLRITESTFTILNLTDTSLISSGPNGLSTEEYFNLSLMYDLPELVLSTEITKLRKNYPKKHKRQALFFKNS